MVVSTFEAPPPTHYSKQPQLSAPAPIPAPPSPAPQPTLHSSPLLLSVLDCVVSDRLAWANMIEQRAEHLACFTESSSGGRIPATPSHTHKKPPSAAVKKTPFHALRAPSVTPSNYLARLVRHSHCSRSAFVTALLYMDRAAARAPELQLNEYNVHRLLLTCVLLATKYHDDILYDSVHFAYVGGVDLAELNKLELTMLKLLDYRLFVSVEEYRVYEAGLVHAVMASPNHAFDQLRLSLVAFQAAERSSCKHHLHVALPPSSPISVLNHTNN